MVQVIGGLGVGLLVALLLVAWRLASGPVSIGFLTPYIKNALTEVHQGNLDLNVDDTILTWAGWERTLDIRIVNLRTALPDGQEIARVPEVSISLSAEALLHGTIAPRSIEVFGPSFSLTRETDGGFALGMQTDGVEDVASGGANAFLSSMILLLLQDPAPDRAMSYLRRINIIGGDITYDDKALGVVWRVPKANARFLRADGGLDAELDLEMQAGDKVAAFSVIGQYQSEGRRIDLGVSFEDLRPSDFVSLTPDWTILKALDLPLSGTVTVSMEQTGRIEGVGFDLDGGAGHLALPVDLAAKWDVLAWAQRIRLNGAAVSGRYDGNAGTVDLSALELSVAAGERVYLAAPFDHALAVHKISTALSYAPKEGVLKAEDLTLALGVDDDGPVARFDATVSGLTPDALEGGRTLALSADITGSAANVAFNDLHHYWPKTLGVNARDWVMPGLRDGVADRASISVALRPGRSGETELVSLAGDIHASGVTVNYLDPMPPVRNASASAAFTEKRFDIDIHGGEGPYGLKVLGGQVALSKLLFDVPEADIDLEILGPVQGALALIDHQPLGFASELGIKPESANGTATTKVNLHFPLIEDLLAKDVEAQAESRISDAVIMEAVFDKELVEGDLLLSVSTNDLELTGTGQLGGVPVQINWNHDFREQALFRDRYELSGEIADVLNLGSLGIHVPDILARYMRGGAQANVNYTELGDGRQSLSARMDLSNIALAAPELGWSKPQGVPGTAVLELRLRDDVPREIPKFEVTAPDMTITGTARFQADGKLERIDIDTMRSGLTDVSGSLTPDGKAWELVLRGESLDASLLWDEMLGIRQIAPRNDATDEQLVLNIAVDINTLMLRKDRVIHDLIGTVYRDRGLWRKLDILGVAGESGSIELLLDTDTDGLRYLSIASDDAGAALKALDLYDNILGGTFDLKAAYTQPGDGAPLEGVVKVTDYAMIDAPAFAQLIGIMSLTGVLDALQGEGLNFDILEAPFKLDQGILRLQDARASGPTIGVTASGTLDLDKRIMNMEGTVVPAYAINALLGKIPLIGELFTGSEKGGGLFAATYTMKGTAENVDITVNPLSALAPGALRNIFTGSRPSSDVKGTSKPTPIDPQPQAPEPVEPQSPRAAPVSPVTPTPVQ